MISVDTVMTVMNGFGVLFILLAVYLLAILVIRKSIWNYPPVASMYIFLAIFCLFVGVVVVKQIEITSTIGILMFIVAIIWGLVTFYLPARRKESIYAKKENN